jgi:hypothetical protein
MPSASYLKNKESIFRWRQRHPEDWARTHNRQNETYYAKHKEKLKKYYREKAAYMREAKIFREIMLQ